MPGRPPNQAAVPMASTVEELQLPALAVAARSAAATARIVQCWRGRALDSSDEEPPAFVDSSDEEGAHK